MYRLEILTARTRTAIDNLLCLAYDLRHPRQTFWAIMARRAFAAGDTTASVVFSEKARGATDW